MRDDFNFPSGYCYWYYYYAYIALLYAEYTVWYTVLIIIRDNYVDSL